MTGMHARYVRVSMIDFFCKFHVVNFKPRRLAAKAEIPPQTKGRGRGRGGKGRGRGRGRGNTSDKPADPEPATRTVALPWPHNIREPIPVNHFVCVRARTSNDKVNGDDSMDNNSVEQAAQPSEPTTTCKAQKPKAKPKAASKANPEGSKTKPKAKAKAKAKSSPAAADSAGSSKMQADHDDEPRQDPGPVVKRKRYSATLLGVRIPAFERYIAA